MGPLRGAEVTHFVSMAPVDYTPLYSELLVAILQLPDLGGQCCPFALFFPVLEVGLVVCVPLLEGC